MSATAPKAEALRINIGRLNTKDQIFAASLLAQLPRKGLSEKQWQWVDILADRATGVTVPPRATAEIGDVAPIVKLMETAARTLKRPALLISTAGPDTLRISIAGNGSRRTGDIKVMTDSLSNGVRTWMGWISKDGKFEPGAKLTPNAVQNVTSALREFAADPTGVAARYGRLTGHCCFCRLTLTDARSTSVGYGPICAKNWDLPWGDC